LRGLAISQLCISPNKNIKIRTLLFISPWYKSTRDKLKRHYIEFLKRQAIIKKN